MRLYHGTSSKLIPSIMKNGILRSDHEDDRGIDTVCALDSLQKARSVAGYFGADGVVIEFDVDDKYVWFHPDYGPESPEFDTIHIMVDIPPSSIVNIIPAPSKLQNPRPAGKQLRTWKSEQQAINPNFNKMLDDILKDI